MAFPASDATFHELKTRLPDPVSYFLGRIWAHWYLPQSPSYSATHRRGSFLVEGEDPLWSFASTLFPYGSFAKGGWRTAGEPTPSLLRENESGRLACCFLRDGSSLQDGLRPHSGRGPSRRRSVSHLGGVSSLAAAGSAVPSGLTF